MPFQFKKNKFNNVSIVYEPDTKKAIRLAKTQQGYTYISYTPSKYSFELDYQSDIKNTHRVIGQEFDKVVMVMGSKFYYFDGELRSKSHPNPDYIYTRLLFQGLTRAISEIKLIITDKQLLDNILFLF